MLYAFCSSVVWQCWLVSKKCILSMKYLCHFFQKVLFWNKWMKKTEAVTSPGALGKMAFKTKMSTDRLVLMSYSWCGLSVKIFLICVVGIQHWLDKRRICAWISVIWLASLEVAASSTSVLKSTLVLNVFCSPHTVFIIDELYGIVVAST